MSNTTLIRLLPAILIFILSGCSLDTLNLLASESVFERTADIAYGPDLRQRLDIYKPVAASSRTPVVVFFYGGGWHNGNKNSFLYVASALTKRGLVTVIPDYRLYPNIKFPAFVQDGAAAVAWVQQHIADYGGDPDHIVVMGHSAGAHIAALLALDERYLRALAARPVQGMIGLSGPYDFLPFSHVEMNDIFGPAERYPESQPINFVDVKDPPLLLLHGGRDTLVSPSNTLNLANRVNARGGCVESVIYPRLDHVTLLVRLSPWLLKPDILNRVENFAKAPGCKNHESITVTQGSGDH
ncbi:MAG TPA: alpha/beta hydrolase [Gammaproteobacteria bacterium]|nr:alpha/beta hydrolase [Gammaproteobacteria bacterium]